MSPRTGCASAAVCLALLLGPSVFATIVQPGDRFVPLQSPGLVLPIDGSMLAESTRPYHIDYALASPPGFELVAPKFVDGSVTTQVIRTAESGTLAFLYTFDFTSRLTGSEQ